MKQCVICLHLKTVGDSWKAMGCSFHNLAGGKRKTGGKLCFFPVSSWMVNQIGQCQRLQRECATDRGLTGVCCRTGIGKNLEYRKQVMPPGLVAGAQRKSWQEVTED